MKLNQILTIIFSILIVLFSVHIFYVNTEGARIDLTEDQLYSLTDGTVDILERMQKEGVKPIEVKLYFSHTAGKTLPSFIKNFITYEAYVRNLLKEYERYSEGKIQVSFIDPKPDTDEADDAADYGLEGKPINNQGDQFFFGIAFETQTGSRDRIEWLWPEKQESIEYEISKRIYNLIWPSSKRIGIMSGLDPLPDTNPYMARLLAAQGKQPGQPWLNMELLQEQYELEMVTLEEGRIPKETYDLVMVIHPKAFSEKQLWALDQWVVTGGNTVLFLDNYAINDQPPQNPNNQFAAYQYEPASQLDKLMNKWGLEQPKQTFAVDLELAVNRPVDNSGRAADVVVDLETDSQNADQILNRDHPIFSGVENIRMFMSAVLKKAGDSELQFTPLIQTSDRSGTAVIKPGFGSDRNALFYTDINTPGRIVDNSRLSEETLVLAYQIQGRFPSAFPEGASFPAEEQQPPPGMPPGMQMPPAENAEMITVEAVPEDHRSEAVVVVFADVDLISDQLGFQRSILGTMAVNDNHKVMLNTADYLLGSEELMKVRAKHKIQRPFIRFDQIEAEADRRLLAQEQSIRQEIADLEDQMREKQRGVNAENAVLLKKKLRDDIQTMEDRIREGNRELREIRKIKNAALENEKAVVRFSIIWFMPLLVTIGGIANLIRKRSTRSGSQGGNS